jgi:LPPG:FO 2-phospho-L-lactate transferase
MESSALQVAKMYQDFLDLFVLDVADATLADQVAELDIEPLVTETVMRDIQAKRNLAAATLSALGLPPDGRGAHSR